MWTLMTAPTSQSRRRARFEAWAIAVALLAAPVLISACSVGDSGASQADHVTGPTGLGATSKNWSTAHDPVGSSKTSFGPVVATGAGAKPRYTVVTLSNDHVAGWVMAFSGGTTLAAAQRAVGRDLPADTQQTASSRESNQSGTGACEVVSFQSTEVGLALAGDPTLAGGKFTVSYFEVDPSGSIAPTYTHVNRAIVGVASPVPQPVCPAPE
jgi:hypothetical protein